MTSDNNNSISNNYSSKDYWNNRFDKTEHFDWYVGWNELKEIVTPLINETSNILMVGCGNSKVSENIYIEGFCNITNIDISDVVIDKMNKSKEEKGLSSMKYIEMDATNMTFDSNSFDVVIDKGTLDALNCSDSDKLSCDLIREMYRVTKNNGYILLISHSGPDLRLGLFIKSLGFGGYELDCQKLELSLMSNLINSIRSKKDSNITMKEAINDKNVLISSLIDVCQRRQNKRSSESLLKLGKYLKIMKLINEKKKEKEQKETKTTSEDRNEDKSEDNKNSDEKIKNGVDEEKSKGIGTSEKSLRKDHCYCFLIKKIINE